MIHSRRRRIRRVVGRLLASAVLVVPLLLVVAPSQASAVVCGQFSHAWVATTGQGSVFGGSTLTVDENTSLFPTGVIAPFQVVSFVFANTQTGAVHQHITHQARENCVVHHEPEETRGR